MLSISFSCNFLIASIWSLYYWSFLNLWISNYFVFSISNYYILILNFSRSSLNLIYSTSPSHFTMLNLELSSVISLSLAWIISWIFLTYSSYIEIFWKWFFFRFSIFSYSRKFKLIIITIKKYWMIPTHWNRLHFNI